MTLRFVAGFDDDDSSNSYNKWDTWTGVNGPSGTYGRNGKGIQIISNNVLGITKTVPSNDTYILGTAWYFNHATNEQTVGGFQFLEGSTLHINVRPKRAAGTFEIYRNTTLVDTSSGSLWSPQTWHYLEIKVVVHDTTGSVVINLDGTEVYDSGSIDTRNGGTGVIDKFQFGCNSGTPTWIDDLYLCDDLGSVNNAMLGDCVVEALTPNGNGNYSDFVGQDADSTDNYLNVDDGATVDDDTTYNAAGTAADTDSYAFGNMTADSGATIFGVQVGGIVRHEGGGGTMRFMHRRSATDDNGATQTPAAGYAWLGDIWEQDPQAGPGAWTVANVDASEFGIDIVT